MGLRLNAKTPSVIKSIGMVSVNADSKALPKGNQAPQEQQKQATERLLVFRDILACRAASDHDRPTGDVQDNTGDPRCIIRSEVESCVRDVLGCSETPDRMPFDEIFLLTRGNARLVSLGQDRFRSNAVRPNSIRTDLAGKVLGENLYTGLGGGIGDGGHGIWPARGGRRHRNDVAGLALLHARQKAFYREEGGGE